MSSPSLTLVSYSQFETILGTALGEYKNKTGNDLLDNWLAKELQSRDSVDTILDIIQHQAEAFDKFRYDDEKLMKWIGPSVRVLYKISATLSGGVDMALPSAKAVFAGIGVLLAEGKGVRENYHALAPLFQRIDFLLRRLGVQTRISPTEDLVKIHVKIAAEVLCILSIATKDAQQSRRKGYFLQQLVGKTDIEDSLKRLDGLTQEGVRMAIAQALTSINGLQTEAINTNEAVQQVANVGQIAWNQIERGIRKWFSSPDPSTNYDIACEAYHEGTATWFLGSSIFKEWELIGPLLWIHGKPGSGKSILCSAIIKHIISLRDARHASLAYFYFDFEDNEKQNVRNFVTSLLTQLAASSERCCDIIFRLYSIHGNGVQQPDIGVLTNCLHEMLFVAAQQPIYVIADALDECPNMSGTPTPRKAVLDLLKGLVNLCVPNLHICVTSRPEFDITTVLRPLAYCAVSLHDEKGQQRAISDYVTNIIYSNRKMRRWRDVDQELVVDVLSKRADGMFRWVFCQLEVLLHCIPQSIRRVLNELPETLDETYARVLREISPANHARTYRLLQCLMVAVRPLRVEELAEVLAFEFDTVQGAIPRYSPDWRPNDQVHAILSTCSSLVAIVDNHGSQVVQFSHFSVKEFLTSDRLASSRGDISWYHLLPGPAHTVFAQACLGLLLRLDHHMDEEIIDDFPLAEYAAEHWVTHAQFENVASRVKVGMESLFDPDKPHFAAWVGIYNIDEPYRELSEVPTPLYYSSLCGFSDLAEWLAIKHPQHVNAIGGRYEFPLLAALRRKHFPVAKILLKHGANVNIRGMRQQTPLHEAIRDVSTVQFLLEYGADINCRQDDLRTPLHLVARYGELEVARMLLEHKADVKSRDKEGKTPLNLLFENGDRDDDDILDLARLLLEHGSDANIRTTNEWTPLHRSAVRGRLEIARILLDHGANTNAENDQGETPLHLVSRGNYDSQERGVGIAKLLLERGADAHARDKDYVTPWLLARYHGRFDIARVLLYHDAKAPTEDK